MNTYIAFVRAINVAGHPKVGMRDPSLVFFKAGCENVSTYGHAGNVLFQLPGQRPNLLNDALRGALHELLGGDVPPFTTRNWSSVVKLSQRLLLLRH